MNNALLKNTPQQIIKDIQEIDRNVFAATVYSDPDKIISSIEFYRKELIQPISAEEIEEAKSIINSLKAILSLKVTLTKATLKMDTSEDILIAGGLSRQTEIEFPNLPTTDNIIDAKDKFVKNANKQPARKENSYFKGYTRIVILGSPTELSKKVAKLVQDNPKTAEEIDEIAELLVKEGKESVALNLSIDLFEKHNLKKREEVEKRFLFELLPLYKGVKLNDSKKKEVENMTLIQWTEYLNDTSKLIKSKGDIIKAAVKEYKGKDKCISLYTASIIDKFNGTSETKEDIIKMIASELKMKPEDLVWEVKTEEATENNDETFNLAEFKKRTLNLLLNKGPLDSIQIGHKFFKENISKVTDYEFKNDEKKREAIWECIKTDFKKNIGKKETTPNKDQIVDALHDKAIELENQEKKNMSGKEFEFRREIQSIVDSKDPQGLKKVQELYNKKYKDIFKKEGKVIDPTKLFNEALTIVEEPEKEVKIETEENKTTLLSKGPVNIETEYPDIWKAAKSCVTLEDLIDTIKMILNNEVKDLQAVSGRMSTKEMVACALMTQYINNIEECKNWDKSKIWEWWGSFRKTMKSPLSEKESSGISKEDSTEKKDGKKVNPVMTEAEKKMNTPKLGEDKSSASASTTVTQQNVTGKDAGQKQNVQNEPAGSSEEAINNVSKDVKVDLKSTIESKEKISGKNVIPTNTAGHTEESSKLQPSTEKKEGDLGKESKTAGTENAGSKLQESEQTVKNNADIESTNKENGDSKPGEDISSADGKKADVNGTNGKEDIPAESAKTNGEDSKTVIVPEELHKKYEFIIKEKDTKRVRLLVEGFLLENAYLTFNERVDVVIVNYLKKNNKWDRCPKHEILNFITSIIKDSEKLKEMEEAKALIENIIANKKAKREEKKNKK